jgi:hypothetical protein
MGSGNRPDRDAVEEFQAAQSLLCVSGEMADAYVLIEDHVRQATAAGLRCADYCVRNMQEFEHQTDLESELSVSKP